MGYRDGNNPPPKPEDMLRRYDVRNGAMMRMALGCFYAVKGHSRRLHDFYGQPQPNHPDNICQIETLPFQKWHPFPNNDRPFNIKPIHLLEEGYNTVIIEFENPDVEDNIIASGFIDPEDEYIIRLVFFANYDTFSDKPIEENFTVFIAKKNEDNDTVSYSDIDAALHAKVVVLPGPKFAPDVIPDITPDVI